VAQSLSSVAATKVQYAVRTSPRHVATCDNDANMPSETATARQLFFLHTSTWFPNFPYAWVRTRMYLHACIIRGETLDIEIQSIDKELPRLSKVEPLQQPRRSWHAWHIPAQRIVYGVLSSYREWEMGVLDLLVLINPQPSA
jgi:hypothetical protein